MAVFKVNYYNISKQRPSLSANTRAPCGVTHQHHWLWHGL